MLETSSEVSSLDHFEAAEGSPDTDNNNQLPELREELHDFAQWALGPDGFSSLRVIAFGDFSYGRRFSRTNVLLCKTQLEQQEAAGLSFRRLRSDDQELLDLLEKYSNVLEACPTDSLFED